MKITKKLLRQWGACWNDDQIAEAIARFGRDPSPREVANDDNVSLEDRLWAVTKALWHCDESAARLFAIECAETVAHLAGDEDDVAQFLGLCAQLREIELVLPESEKDAARCAAWGAARDAVWDAARGAARGAAIKDAIDRALHWLGAEADS